MAMHNVPLLMDNDLNECDRDYVENIIQTWSLPGVEEIGGVLGMVYRNSHLQLVDFDEPRQQGVVVDFLSGESLYRQQHGGGKKEPIAKAVGVKGGLSPTVLDATPGLGRDAFVLASQGCRVIMIERSPVVAALLSDGLKRLAAAAPELAKKLELIHGNSIETMLSLERAIDVVYLDPMFPHKKKSALVKKEMRIFQQLLGSDDDADNLLMPAKALASKRVVVKRPNSALPLAESKPSMSITSKKHRFDVYINTNQ